MLFLVGLIRSRKMIFKKSPCAASSEMINVPFKLSVAIADHRVFIDFHGTQKT